jgi:hypothetical protein
VLNQDQKRGANALAACLGIALACVAGALLTNYEDLWIVALVMGLISVPVTAIFRCDKGWPRTAMAAYTGGLLLVGLASAVPLEVFPASMLPLIVQLACNSFLLFAIGILASQFLANYLMQATAKR